MRAWITLSLALATAIAVPVGAQDMSQTGATAVTVSTDRNVAASLPQGTLVSYQQATAQVPETVTLRFDWNGTPLFGTFLVGQNMNWTSGGQMVMLASATQGSTITVPGNAKIVSLTFNGPSGVGVIQSIDWNANTVTVQLPTGETRTLQFSPNAMFVRAGQLTPLSHLNKGDWVLFQIPPAQNMVGEFTDVGKPVQATVKTVGPNEMTVAFESKGHPATKTYQFDWDTQYINQGTSIPAGTLSTFYQPGQTVWIFGSLDHPLYVISNPNAGFETAIAGAPATTETTTAAAPTTTPPCAMPGTTGNVAQGATTGAATGTTTEAQGTSTASTTSTPSVTTAVSTTGTMPSFSQGTLVQYTPASGNMPAMATVRFDWNGTPVLGTYAVQPSDQWMSNGQAIDWTQIQPGATVSIPSTVNLASLSFGGPTGVGTIRSIDRVNDMVTVRLPNGQMRVLRYSPQAMFFQTGQPVTDISSLSTGQTVMFEVAPGTNSVALFQPIQPGVRATIASVSPTGITVRYRQNGQPVTQTFATDNSNLRFYSGGQLVTASNFQGTYQPGQVVWIYGQSGQPQFVASNVQTGYEAAVISRPSRVAAVRQTPRARRAVRGYRGRAVVTRHVRHHRVTRHVRQHRARVLGYRGTRAAAAACAQCARYQRMHRGAAVRGYRGARSARYHRMHRGAAVRGYRGAGK